MDVYRGADKVAEMDDYDQLHVGADKPAFVYEGGELVYPNPIKDGLVLWYDFKGMKNMDVSKGVAQDLSGSGNDGTLENFNYTAESGYTSDGLKVDNIDDFVSTTTTEEMTTFTMETTVLCGAPNTQIFWGGAPNAFYLRRYGTSSLHASIYTDSQETGSVPGVFEYQTPRKINCGLIVDPENGLFKIYADGAILLEKEILGEATPWELTHVGRWSAVYDDNLDGLIYSAKLYNRALKPEEIAHNYAIEKERFGL